MAENENGQEKTEEATAKKLAKSREEGQVARSKELTTTLLMLASVLGVKVLGAGLSEALLGMMRFNFTMSPDVAFDEKLMLSHLVNTTSAAVLGVIPIFIVLILAAFIGPIALGGFLFSAKAVAPKLERMSPIKGLKRMFSLNSLVELFKAIGKVLLVGSASVVMLLHFKNDLLSLAYAPLEPAIVEMLSIIVWSLLAISSSLILISAIDVPYQIFDHNKKMRMTLQEVKDEMKDVEGKPEVKGRRRQMQMELSQRRMMESVPEADVVITNPDHFSVALKYDVDGSGAPVVVAKGVDFLAIKIREVANAHDVMLLQIPPLARAVYFTTNIDDEIPNTLYLAVAQVLAYVFQLRAHQKGKGKPPKPLAEIEVPREALYDTQGNLAPEH
jgi:flagellar biosynthetic protein FlhB